MPVVFGTANTVTGSGTWTYPDVGLVIGLLVQVNAVADGVDSWGTTIPRYTGVGVFAPITEAGRTIGRPIGNDQLVTYDIGHGPTGVAWDLADGTEITITEILSETPPTGGGGGGVANSIAVIENSTTKSIAPYTSTTLDLDQVTVAGDSTTFDTSVSGSIKVLNNGVYRINLGVVVPSDNPGPNAYASIQVNGSLWVAAALLWLSGATAAWCEMTNEYPLNAGDVVTGQAFHEASGSVPYDATLSVALDG